MEFLNYKVSFHSNNQALTNQFLSDVRSRTPVLHYLFVNVIIYQNIVRVDEAENILYAILYAILYCIVFSLSQSQYAHSFSNFMLEIVEST